MSPTNELPHQNNIDIIHLSMSLLIGDRLVTFLIPAYSTCCLFCQCVIPKQFKSCKLFRESVNNFRAQFQDFLSSNLLKDFEDVEYEIKSIEADRAVRLAIMEIFKVIKVDSDEKVNFSV